MTPVIFHPAARGELRRAVQYYNEKSPRLGIALAHQVKAAVRTILEYPESGSPTDLGMRRKVLTRFPYTMVYSVEPHRIYILAIAHHRREPTYWHDRLRSRWRRPSDRRKKDEG